MAHQVGERLRCDDCGAEIVFMKACPCPETEPKTHSNICCEREMRRIGIDSNPEPPQPHAGR